MSNAIKIVEVGPRDGLQSERGVISVAHKIALIQQLYAAGLRSIEVGSFVSPQAVPQMATTAEVVARLSTRGHSQSNPLADWMVLVPNEQGMHAAIKAGVRHVAIFTAASETFTQRNIRCSISESLERFGPIMELAREHKMRVRGYVSCVCGCPYEGAVAPAIVAQVAEQLMTLGCEEISLGDTLGVGTPTGWRHVLQAVGIGVPLRQIAVHCHDTYGQAIANIREALTLGVCTVDSSIAGLGGCPYAPGSSGNVATEDVVYLLKGEGLDTGVQLPLLIETACFVRDTLGLPIHSKVSLAMQGHFALAT